MSTVCWERDDEGRGHSVALWEPRADGHVVHGTEVVSIGGSALSCDFRIELDDAWRTRRVAARSCSDLGERTLDLVVDDDGWSVDGVRRADLLGCVDVDVAATPLTNTFPIRRLAGLPVGQPVTSAVAWVDVPSLSVGRVEQTYERLPGRGGLAAWRYSDPTHGAFTLTVDDDGLVVDYEGFARRVSPRP